MHLLSAIIVAVAILVAVGTIADAITKGLKMSDVSTQLLAGMNAAADKIVAKFNDLSTAPAERDALKQEVADLQTGMQGVLDKLNAIAG